MVTVRSAARVLLFYTIADLRKSGG